jgi:multicomponent Na+:H+ antiporter subunit A
LSLLHFVVIMPFLFALCSPYVYRFRQQIHTGWFMLPAPVSIFIYFLTRLPMIKDGEPVTASIPWIPSLGITFTVYLDGLSLLFALLISGIGSLVMVYSIFYLGKSKEKLGSFYTYLLLFMGAMLGVVLSDNLIVLYGFWELTSISSFLLIAFWHQRERSTYGALKSMLITVFGGLAMLAGFVLLYVLTGTFSIRAIIGGAGEISGDSLFIPALLLILLGAFTKSAQFPFHIWLPDAMEAPTPVSAYLHSATMVKAGLYLVARFSPIFAGEASWFWIVSAGGLLTLIYGAFRALKQTDLKALLAFSTISQLGLIMCLLGLGSAAAVYAGNTESLFYVKATMAGIFHLMNHAVFKGALFMVVGIVDHETGTRDIRKLGGLMSLMPITFSIALIGTFSMAGLPPFSGFLSKEMFFTAVLNITELNLFNMDSLGILFPVIAWVASIFTFSYSMLLLLRTFRGKLQESKLPKTPHEAPLGLLLPPLVLAALALVFGIFPNLLAYTLIEPAMAAIHPALLAPGQQFDTAIHFWHGWTMELLMTAGVVAAGIIIYRLHPRLKWLHSAWFERATLNKTYDGGLGLLDKGARGLTRRYMTGSHRHYLFYIFGFIIAALAITLLMSNGLSFHLDLSAHANMPLYEGIILLALIAAAIAVPFARTRMLGIILTGTVGYIVTLFFVIFRAPDLALTQMIVETVSVALFLLCFYHLPKLKRERERLKFRLPNLIIALGVGIVMTLLALSASGESPFPSISEYFVKGSYELAGGKNIVNVILVDFRGFDTMLEIVVLGIASYGIYALIRLKPGDDDGVAHQGYWESGKRLVLGGQQSNDVILKTIAQLIIFIILIFSFYLFLAGHNEPGGGFIGALMAASALVLLAMAFGIRTLKAVIPFDFRKVTATGIIIALLTGIGSFVFKAPFLSHSFGYFNLPFFGQTELATAMLFDLGVYLTVIGITMTIILAIGRDE